MRPLIFITILVIYGAFVTDAHSKSPPDLPLPACTVVDGVKQGACPMTSDFLSGSVTGKLSVGGAVIVSPAPDIPVCNSTGWSPSPCYSAVLEPRAIGCGYIDLLDGKKWKDSSCPFVIPTTFFQDSFTMTSTNTGGSCDAEGDFQTYFYGGPANVPDRIWSAVGPTRLDCNVSFNGTRPDRLLGPTWVKFRVGIDKAETGSDERHGRAVYAEVYAPIDGDLREIPLEIDIRFADNRTDDTVEIDEEFELVIELKGSEFFEGATDIEFDASISNTKALSVLSAPEEPGPFNLAGGASRSFTWSLKALEKGVFTLSASGRGKGSSGDFFSFRANLPVRILSSEFDVEVTATPTPFKVNETLSTELGEKCQAYNQALVDQNREDERIPNCIQIDVKVTNDDDQTIENVSMLHKDDITEAIDVLTESTDIEENKVPLIQIDYLIPVNDNGEELSDPIKLEPGESATFTWLVEAEAESNPLEIRPVVLGSIDNANVQGSGVGELEIKENILLKFGAKLKYPNFTPFSGAPIRLEGFLENHSTENWISATVIAYPEDNAGRGVLFDQASDYRPGVKTDSRSCRRFAEIEADGLPDYLQVFMIPPAEAEDEPTRINLEGVLATLCWDEVSEATVSYVVRSYTLQTDSDGKLVTDSQGNAIKLDEISEQTKIEDEEGYNDTFTVALKANPDIPADEVTSDCQYVLWGFHLGCEGARGVYAFGYGLAIEFPQFLFEVGKQDLYYGARLAHWTADQWANMYRAFVNEDADAYAKLIAEAKLVTESFVRAAVITADQQEALVVSAVDELGSLADDFEKGDYKKLTGKGAYLAGENIDAILGSGLVKSLATKMQRGRATANAAEISGLTKSVNTALDNASVNSKALAVERKVLPSRDEALLNQGDALSYRVTEALGGVPKDIMIKIENIATKYNANLAFRSRGFGAIEKLKNGLAYFKPQPVKLKNTNQMDVDWFGYPAQALDQVIFVEPPAEIVRAFNEVFDDPSSYTIKVVDGEEVRIYKKNLPNDIRITRALDEWVKSHPKFDSLGITDKPNGLTGLDLVLDRDVITKIDDFDKPENFEGYLAVRERLRLHGEEWFDYQKTDKFGPLGEDGATFTKGKYVKDGLPLEFEYSVNGLPAVLDQIPYVKGSKRDFRVAEGAVIDNPNGDKYTQLKTTDGRRIFTPQMDGPNGFRGFTGDIDFMHILDASGAIIANPIRRFLIYFELAKEVGMQHGESFTFALNEASRSRYLNAHDVASPVREVLYSVFPNRVKVAAFYAKHRTILADLGNGIEQVNSGEKVRQYFVPITGGNHRLRTAALRTLSESIELILKPTSNWERFISSLDRSLNWIVPLNWLSRATGVNDSDVDSKYRGDRGSDDSQIVQERDGELVTLQPTVNRSTNRQFQIPPISYEWVPVDPAGVRDANGLISSLPFSTLRVDFAASSTEIEVARLDELGIDADSSFIQEDDFLVISPASSTEETVRVISINPLIIESGLRFDHYAGEMVAVLPLRFFSVTAVDSDGDGSWDIDDLFPNNPAEYADSDLDGVGDNEDTDDDNDGFTDTEELLAGSSSTDDQDTPIEHQPVTPVIISTMPATLEPTSGLYIESSFFDDPDMNATRSSNRIRISRPDLAAERGLVYEGDVQSLDPLRLSKSILDLAVSYTLELSYIDDTGLASDYSEPLEFISPAADPFDIDGNLMQDGIEASTDQDFNGNGELDSSEGIVTVVQLGNGELRGIQSSAGTITRVTGYSPDELPAGLTLSNGMIGYRVDDLGVGQAVDMTYWFTTDLSAGYRWYQYNESFTSDASLIDRTGDMAIAGNSVRLSVTDGGEGDLDGVANGRIVDASGGIHADGSDNAGDPDPTTPSGSGGGGGGCTIASVEVPFNPFMPAMILGSIGVLAFRRRKACSTKDRGIDCSR